MQDMITTPEAFFERIVKPDVDDFFNNPADIRMAFHACMSLDHLRDWVAKAKGEDIGSFTDNLYERCPAIRAIREISVNAKHFPPNPKQAQKVLVGVTAKGMSWNDLDISWDDMQGSWDTLGAPQLITKSETGETGWVLILISKGYAFWKQQLQPENKDAA